MSSPEKKSVVEWINGVNYSEDPTYVPSNFALKFITFIKLVMVVKVKRIRPL